MESRKIHIGIDPGVDGFITVFYPDGATKSFEMPKIGKEVDLHALNNVFINLTMDNTLNNVHCVMEDVHSIFGSSANSNFTFGSINGSLKAFLMAHNISHTLVQPKKWQKEMWEGIKLQQKPSSTGKTMKTDTKSMSLIAFKRLFPNIDPRRNGLCKNPDDNKVDSVLLAEYSRRKFD
jgi:hypothetical protein